MSVLGTPSQFPFSPARLVEDTDWNQVVDNLTGSQVKSGSLTINVSSTALTVSGITNLNTTNITGSLTVGAGNIGSTSIQNPTTFSSANGVVITGPFTQQSSPFTIGLANNNSTINGAVILNGQAIGAPLLTKSLEVASGSITLDTGSILVNGNAFISGSLTAANFTGILSSGNITGSLITGSIQASGIISSGNITGSIITGSGFQTSSPSTLGTLNIVSGSNITLNSGSINIPFGNVTANTFFGTVSGSLIVTGSIIVPSGSNITLQSGSIFSPFAGAFFGGNITGSIITGSTLLSAGIFAGNITGSIITGSILASGINSSGNITGSIITGSIQSSSVTSSGIISGSGFQAASASTLGSITLVSGSNLTLNSGSINVPFGNVTANTFFGTVSGSIIVTGSVTIPSGSNLILQSGSIIPFALPSGYVVFSGSVSGITGPYYAVNGSTNNIDFAGSDAGAIINSSINKISSSPLLGGKVFIKNGTYNVTTTIIPKSNVEIEGEYKSSVILKATGNNQSIMTGSALSGSIPTQIRIDNLRFDTGGFTGCTALNMSGTEASVINHFSNLITTGNFLTAFNLDGNEDSILENSFVTNAGDVYFHNVGGNVYIRELVIGTVNEAILHVGGQTTLVEDSVFNTVMFDNQSGSVSTGSSVQSINIKFKDCYMANPTNSAGNHKFTFPDLSTVRSLELDTVYVGLRNNNAVFASLQPGGGIQRLDVHNCTFQNIDSSSIIWASGSSSTPPNFGGGGSNFVDGSPFFVWKANQISGTINPGNTCSNGLFSYTFGNNSTGIQPTTKTTANSFDNTLLRIFPLIGTSSNPSGSSSSSTTYTIFGYGCKIISTSGSGVNVSINGFSTGQTSGIFDVVPGDTINFGTFSVTPSVNVLFKVGW